MTPYALLKLRCGLSHQEAAALHGVRLDTVQSWVIGRNQAPAGAIAELRTLYRQIDTTAHEAALRIRRMRPQPDTVELGLASDDHEAHQLGLPCVGAHRALLGLVVARVALPVRIVPRGSTVATAAALEGHSVARRELDQKS